MARALRGLPRRGLWLLLAHHLFLVTACQDAHYGALMQELCLSRFQKDMEAMGRTLWCDWGKTIGPQGPGLLSVFGMLPRCLEHFEACTILQPWSWALPGPVLRGGLVLTLWALNHALPDPHQFLGGEAQASVDTLHPAVSSSPETQEGAPVPPSVAVTLFLPASM
ncbi:receptor activity-modifying protein 1 [Octodon degus]|uniref:Receptor activity-modifying protein 1 n=1 Tax=Octodon degus TaxID=10160 RepID=A0A6P6F080_OCTDE|nr:receptor activity-modifying protein 1 [Octodon degus]